MQKQKNKTFVLRLMSLFVIVLVISAAAILRDGKLLGHDMGEALATSAAVAVDNDTLEVLPDGAIVVNTRLLAKDVQGYGGPVALRIHIDKGGVVDNIEAEPNAETPDFFNHAKTVMARWQGKTVDEAMAEQVDAVTGATFSSRAIIENVHRGLAYAKQHAALGNASGAADSADVQADAYLAKGWTIGGVAALIVVLLGAVVPLLLNNRRWHNVQLVLNVVVLGLWTGTFVSYTLLMRLFAGGRKYRFAWCACSSFADGCGGNVLSFGWQIRSLLRSSLPVRFGSGTCRKTFTSQTSHYVAAEQKA